MMRLPVLILCGCLLGFVVLPSGAESETQPSVKQPANASDEVLAAYRRQIDMISDNINTLESRLDRWHLDQPGSVAVQTHELQVLVEHRVSLRIQRVQAGAALDMLNRRLELGDMEPSASEVLELEAMPLNVALETELVSLRAAYAVAEDEAAQADINSSPELDRLGILIERISREKADAWDATARRLIRARLDASTQRVALLEDQLSDLDNEIAQAAARLEDITRAQRTRRSLERRLLAYENRREVLAARLQDLELQ